MTLEEFPPRSDGSSPTDDYCIEHADELLLFVLFAKTLSIVIGMCLYPWQAWQGRSSHPNNTKSLVDIPLTLNDD